MKTYGNVFSNLVTNFPKLIILITIALTILFGYGMSRLQVASDFQDDLPVNDPVLQSRRYFQEIFGKKHLLIIGIENANTIYNTSTLQKVKEMSEEIKSLKGIIEDEVVSLSTANNIKGLDWGLETGAFMKDVPQSEDDLNKLRKDVQENDMFHGRLVSKDEKMTTIIASMEESNPEQTDRLVEEIYALTKRYEGPERFYFAGDPVGNYEINRGIQHDLNRLLPFSLLLVLTGFFISFRRIRGILIPTIIMVLSIIWTMGLIGLLGYKMNVLTSVIPVVMLAITSSYGIHIIYRYYEAAEEIKDPVRASGEGVRRITQAILMAGITSAIGTITLVIFKIVSIKEFGMFLGIGIVFGFMLALTLGPAILTLLKHQTQKTVKKEDIFDRFMINVARITLRYRTACLIITGVIFLISLYGISLIKVGINFVDFFPKDHKFTTAVNKFNDKAGGTVPLTIMVETPETDGITQPETLRAMLAVEEHARTLKGVGNTDSFARLIKRMHYVMNGEKEEFNVIPDSPDLIAQYLLLYSMSGNPGDFDNLVDYDYRRAKITINLTTFDQEEQEEIFNAIQRFSKTHFSPDIKLAYEGVVYWIAQTGYVVTGKIQNIISSIMIVLLFCIMVYRSLRLGILSVVPLTVSTLLTFGIMGFLGIRLNMATAIITSISVGVGVDFAIHYITHFREEIAKGLNYREATLATMTSSGKAIIFDMLSNVLGFVVFIVSDFVPVQNFGWLVSINMLAVAIGTLFILPVLFSLIKVESLVDYEVHKTERGYKMTHYTKIRWAIVGAGLIFWLIFTFSSAFAGDLTARQIIEKNDEIQTSKDTTSAITMRLINEKGQERLRKISLWEKKDKEDNNNTLVRFQFPSDVKGTGLLTLEHKNSEDDQWLYLPALRKSRRISASDKGDNFMGSDFTFEDMERDDLDEWTYRLLGTEDVNGEPCYHIEAIPFSESKKKETNYSKRESWIRKKDFVMLKINYYDKKGVFIKTLIFSDISLINGKPRAHKMVMENFQRKHKTELLYEDIRIDQGISDSLFTERQLVKE